MSVGFALAHLCTDTSILKTPAYEGEVSGTPFKKTVTTQSGVSLASAVWGAATVLSGNRVKDPQRLVTESVVGSSLEVDKGLTVRLTNAASSEKHDVMVAFPSSGSQHRDLFRVEKCLAELPDSQQTTTIGKLGLAGSQSVSRITINDGTRVVLLDPRNELVSAVATPREAMVHVKLPLTTSVSVRPAQAYLAELEYAKNEPHVSIPLAVGILGLGVLAGSVSSIIKSPLKLYS